MVQTSDPCTLVLFGATGDLAQTSILPSLLELEAQGRLPSSTSVIGCGRRDWDDEEYRRQMRAALPQELDPEAWERLAARLHFCSLDVSDAGGVADLADGISGDVVFHLATPPALFPVIVENLEATGLSRSEHGWRRVVIEKPFGRDRRSARALEHAVARAFGEDQVYRIDHYLGKEAVQNMLVFRFANPGFEPIWNRQYVDHVRITAAESEGVGTRGAFYEETGAVRDMVQNHLLQLLCIVAMEPPTRFEAGSFRNEAVKVLDAVRPLDPERDAVRGQYGAASVGGEEVRAYRAEDDVDGASDVETYAAVRVFVDNWRWSGVPFFLETGKRLDRKQTEVEVRFKPTPHVMFSPEERGRTCGSLAFQIAPEAGVVQRIATKRPGPEVRIATHSMRLVFSRIFDEAPPLSAYAALLDDAMRGDQTLFARADWVDLAWLLVDPLVEAWRTRPTDDFPNYEAGSSGPLAAAGLLPVGGESPA